jgi:NADH dehydrogenase/NADH:ubiquinone oxidoreductase subunit G
LKIIINEQAIEAEDGQTILEAAKENNIYIPTLCHNEELSDVGICRICVVEVKGQKSLQPACVTKVRNNMVIFTDAPRVVNARRTNLRLILANHADNCLVCDAANLCELRKVAAEAGVANSYFIKSRTPRKIDFCHPLIQRDLSKCILCRRCVRACRDIAEKDMWAVAYRGHQTRIVINDDADFDLQSCEDCTACIDVCPVGALINIGVKRTEKNPCAVTVKVAATGSST